MISFKRNTPRTKRMKNSWMKKTDIFPFLNLPYEIRLLIYLAARPQKEDLVVDVCNCAGKQGKPCPKWSTCSGRARHRDLTLAEPTYTLLLLNHQIHDEAMELLDFRQILRFCSFSCLSDELEKYSASQKRLIKAFHVRFAVLNSAPPNYQLAFRKAYNAFEDNEGYYDLIFSARAGYGKFQGEPARLTIDEKGCRTIAELVIHVSRPGFAGPLLCFAYTRKILMGTLPAGA